jgi:hypothetical protein
MPKFKLFEHSTPIFKSMNIVVYRTRKSFDYKVDPFAPSSFENNWKNNRQDWLVIKDDKAEIFRCRCQSVANYCFGKGATADTVSYGDTIYPGRFFLKCFVDPRDFFGEIHAITKTTDYDGQLIDRHAMQTTKDGYQNGRWLLHSMYSKKLGDDTTYAWSSGCIITSSADLKAFNTVLHAYKIQPGETIEGEIIEDF